MTSKLEFNKLQSEEINLIFQSLVDELNKVRNKCVHYIAYINRIQSLTGLSINFLELNTIKIESAKILVELNEALAKNGR